MKPALPEPLAPADRTNIPAEQVKATTGVGAPTAPPAFGDPGAGPAFDRNAQAPPELPDRSRRRRRLAAVVLAGVVLAGAAYLANPVIVDWVRQVGNGAAASSPSPSALPPATRATPAPTPAPTPTARRAAIPSITPTPAEPTSTLAATPHVHVVVKGETLIAIAARYGVTVAAVEKANAITSAGIIYVGEHLIIPAR